MKDQEFTVAMDRVILRLTLRGDACRRAKCMALPDQLFRDLCTRLADRRFTVKSTWQWLKSQTQAAPTRSSIERFSRVLLRELELELGLCAQTN